MTKIDPGLLDFLLKNNLKVICKGCWLYISNKTNTNTIQISDPATTYYSDILMNNFFGFVRGENIPFEHIYSKS